MKCSHTVSAEAQAKLDADEAWLHQNEHEIIAGISAADAELDAVRNIPNESDLASLPPGHKFPVRTSHKAWMRSMRLLP